MADFHGTKHPSKLWSISGLLSCGKGAISRLMGNSLDTSAAIQNSQSFQQNAGERLSPVKLKNFSFIELKNATENFRSDRLLREDDCELVFEGRIYEDTSCASTIRPEVIIAVKKLEQEDFPDHNMWLMEVNCLNQLHHPNLVNLIGFCSEAEGERLLVYEYMSNGNLEDHLSPGRTVPLSWARRIKIAMGIAKGLSFLHDYGVVYGNVEGSNILLDAEFNAKLSDFRLIRRKNKEVCKNFSYIAPECLSTGRQTIKSDVYSFGVVLLELLSGRRATGDRKADVENNLNLWAMQYLGDKYKLHYLMDAKLDGHYPQTAALSFSMLALACLCTKSRQRPLMAEILAGLEQLQIAENTSKVPESEQLICSHTTQKPTMKRLSMMPESTRFNSEAGESANAAFAVSPHRSKSSSITIPQIEGDKILKSFSIKELKDATQNFRPSNLLDDNICKGWIDEKSFVASRPGSGVVIAVKELSQGSRRQPKDWLPELNCIGQLYHPNIVKLIGYCCEDDLRFLVYEFVPRGSLEDHLFRRGIPHLTWALRVRIAIGVAQGLLFLHNHNVVYNNLEHSNILLDMNYNAKLSNVILKRKKKKRSRHAYFYAAPEYLAYGKASAKSDVYSFGIVLLSLLTGRRAIDKNRPAYEKNLVDWAKPFLATKRKILRIVDPRLDSEESKEALIKFARVISHCLSPEPMRSSSSEILAMLESIKPSILDD